RRLSAIYRRSTDAGVARAEDLGIQRRHDKQRSANIKEFVQFGYPYCDLTESNRSSGQHESLRKPGWLPTGIVINILKPGDQRAGKIPGENDLISIEENENFASLNLPQGFDKQDWKPGAVAPIEVIDGQHRLWAFEEEDFAS
ncbi:hypothetical protein ABR330_22600, partial [Bacillus cabrialesii subsp. cabrialesii]|uniref:hypothetical protein n=1 Tax=Bacillus cabrialesii TaxID=2487276 RepID=UPI0033057A5F